MKRPQQHVLETQTKKKFESMVPDTWVARELGADYGLDYLVEIFKKNDSTGNLFFVQLKGTDAEIIDDTISYQLSVDNIMYWNTITNPVLLVFYSSKSDKFWGLWTNELKENISLKKEDQGKYTIKLTLNNLLTPSFFGDLEKQFDNSLPSKINVSYQSNSDKTKLLHQCLEKWLKYFFKDNVQFENHMLPNTCMVEYEFVNPDSLKIQVKAKGKTHNLHPVNFAENQDFLYLPDIQIDNIPKPLSECLMLFALINCEKNIKESLKIIQQTIGDYNGDLLPMESILLLTQVAINHERIDELHELAKTMVLSKRIHEFQLLNISILSLTKDNPLYNIYQQNLLFGIENISDTNLKGTFSYNLANSFRSARDYYSSSIYYQKARRLEPKYKERDYWWFEYAGVLFLTGHYKLAEAFYKKSYDIDNSQNIPLIFGLIGDCEFFQGKFSEAKIKYDEAIGHNVEPNDLMEEFILKGMIVGRLVAANLDNLQLDNSLSLKLTEEGMQKMEQKYYEQAIRMNPLNGLAWFNYSISLNLSGNFESALFAFITTACIQSWDSEAWRNALLLAFSTKRIDLFPVIYGAAYRSIGANLLNQLSQSILDQKHMPIEAKAELIKAFTEVSKAYNDMFKT